jgi:hypothetical protein
MFGVITAISWYMTQRNKRNFTSYGHVIEFYMRNLSHIVNPLYGYISVWFAKFPLTLYTSSENDLERPTRVGVLSRSTKKCNQIYKEYYTVSLCLVPSSHWFLAWLIVLPWRRERHNDALHTKTVISELAAVNFLGVQSGRCAIATLQSRFLRGPHYYYLKLHVIVFPSAIIPLQGGASASMPQEDGGHVIESWRVTTATRVHNTKYCQACVYLLSRGAL